jgi:uncharacterized membrane protein
MSTLEKEQGRVQTIDFLRGLAMIIMALDHVRDYFHAEAFVFDPLDLKATYPVLFFTRWITHFCAPVFVFLAGTSAYLSARNKPIKELSKFLFSRGLWLIFIELSICIFGWTFNPSFDVLILGVIWAIGCSMIALSLLIHLPFKLLLGLGLAILFGHNLLDGIEVKSEGIIQIIWAALHTGDFYTWHGHNIMVFYPVLPWIGIMALGYCFGQLYNYQVLATKRKKVLIALGISSVLLFVLLRLANVYGDPNLRDTSYDGIGALMSFLNTSKYPPSLLYSLMTLGPAFLLLAFSEKWKLKPQNGIVVIGRVPMFYYILHIYLIHLLALFAAWASGYRWQDMVLSTWVNFNPALKDYGFPLYMVYIIWIAVVLMLYPFCKRYNSYKSNNKQKWWLSYL